jgi:hypothetical protein
MRAREAISSARAVVFEIAVATSSVKSARRFSISSAVSVASTIRPV